MSLRTIETLDVSPEHIPSFNKSGLVTTHLGGADLVEVGLWRSPAARALAVLDATQHCVVVPALYNVGVRPYCAPLCRFLWARVVQCEDFCRRNAEHRDKTEKLHRENRTLT